MYPDGLKVLMGKGILHKQPVAALVAIGMTHDPVHALSAWLDK